MLQTEQLRVKLVKGPGVVQRVISCLMVRLRLIKELQLLLLFLP